MRHSYREWRRQADNSLTNSRVRRNAPENYTHPAVLGTVIVFAIIAIAMIILYFFTGWLYAA